MRYKILPSILFLYFSMMAHAQKMSEQEYEQKIREWHQQRAYGEPSYETFKKGITWFLDKCSRGNCEPCLLLISEPINNTSAKAWIGTFESSGPRTIISTMANVNYHTKPLRDGRVHSSTPAFAQKYGTCAKGASRFTCRGGKCVYKNGYHKGKEINASRVEKYERDLGETGIDTLIMYGVTLHEQIMFHDSSNCYGNGQNCGGSWGCITQYPKQQKILCQEYINKARGIHIYNDPKNIRASNSNQGSWQAAARVLERGNICQTVTGPPIQVVTPISGSVGQLLANAGKYESYVSSPKASTYQAGNSFVSGEANLTGNEHFRECQNISEVSYVEEVIDTREGSRINRRRKFAQITNHAEAVYGGGEQNARATVVNHIAKNCQAMAATEPRTKGFLTNNHKKNPISRFFQAFFGAFSSTPKNNSKTGSRLQREDSRSN